jgi:hypothetical protein
VKVFLIRLKNHPEWYVGKQNPSYALSSDRNIEEQRKGWTNHPAFKGRTFSNWDILAQNTGVNNELPHWFAERKRAKLWTDEKSLRRFISLYNTPEDTFSEYEVEIDDGSSITYLSIKNFRKIS